MPGPAAQIRIPFPPSVNSYWHKAVILPRKWSGVIRSLLGPRLWKRVARRFVGQGQWPTVLVFVGEEGKGYRREVVQAICDRFPGLKPTRSRLKVTLTAHMPDRRNHDLDNLCKASLDALTVAQVWEDDEQIDHLEVIRGTVHPPGWLDVRIEKLPVPIQQEMFQ